MIVKQHIPNILTLANLFCGCLAILFLFNPEWNPIKGLTTEFTISILLAASLLFDFFDGFVARALHVDGELGKQLDSLADVISFGLLPGLLLVYCFQVLSQWASPTDFLLPQLLGLFCLIIPLFAAYRLALFNLQDVTTSYFKGLATPAMTLFVYSIFMYIMNMVSTKQVDDHLYTKNFIVYWQGFLLIISVLLAILMVSKLPLFSLKVKSFTWHSNWFRFLLLIVSISLLFLIGFTAFMYIIPFYILLSVIAKKQFI